MRTARPLVSCGRLQFMRLICGPGVGSRMSADVRNAHPSGAERRGTDGEGSVVLALRCGPRVGGRRGDLECNAMLRDLDQRDRRGGKGNCGRLTSHSHAVAWVLIGRSRRVGLRGFGLGDRRVCVSVIRRRGVGGCCDCRRRRAVPGMHGTRVHRHRLGDNKREPGRQQRAKQSGGEPPFHACEKLVGPRLMGNRHGTQATVAEWPCRGPATKRLRTQFCWRPQARDHRLGATT